MTENKRFVWSDKTHHGHVIDTETTEHLSHYSCMVKLNELNDENIKLQERNDRQAEIIRTFYTLIENGDWIGLMDIMKDWKKQYSIRYSKKM